MRRVEIKTFGLAFALLWIGCGDDNSSVDDSGTGTDDVMEAVADSTPGGDDGVRHPDAGNPCEGGSSEPFSEFATGQWSSLWEGDYNDPRTAPSARITAYSGMAVDPVDEQILLFGGGHNNYPGNEVWSFNVRDRTWTEMYEPDDFSDMTLETCMAGVDNVNAPGTWLPSGRPISRHTYDSVEFIDHLGLLIAGGGSTYSGPNSVGFDFWNDVGDPGGCWPNSPRDTWTFNPRTIEWELESFRYPHSDNREFFGASAYDSVGQRVIGEQHFFRAETGTWTPHAPPPRPIAVLTYDALRNRAYGMGGEREGSTWVLAYDIASDTWSELPTTGGPRGTARGYGLSFDRVADRIVALAWDLTEIWTLDPMGGSWVSNPGVPSASSPEGWGATPHGLLKYVDAWNIHLFVTTRPGGRLDAWAYRHEGCSP